MHITPRQRECLLCGVQIVGVEANEVVRIELLRGFSDLRRTGGCLDLCRQNEQFTAGFQKDLSNVAPRGRCDLTGFAVGGSKYLFAQAREVACLLTPRVALRAIIIDQGWDLGRRRQRITRVVRRIHRRLSSAANRS
jgi:hypothetical protein